MFITHTNTLFRTCLHHLDFTDYRLQNDRRRVSSVVEHSSANPKVPGSIPGSVSYRGHGL